MSTCKQLNAETKRRIAALRKEHLRCCKQIDHLERQKQKLMRESARLLAIVAAREMVPDPTEDVAEFKRLQRRKATERIPMLSVHPDAATRDDIAMMAADLMEARRLLCLVLEQIHRDSVDRAHHWPEEVTWNNFGDAIGQYIEPTT